jgi:hypothetical protein
MVLFTVSHVLFIYSRRGSVPARFACAYSAAEIMIALAMLSIFALAAIGPYVLTPSTSEAIRLAEAHEFSSVEVLDMDTFCPPTKGCAEDDAVAYSVRAMNRDDKTVDFTVCCGGFFSRKGCAIRTE